MHEGRQALLVITELFAPTKGGTAVWLNEVYRRIGAKEIHILTAAVPGGPELDRHHPNSIHRVQLRRYWWLRPESLGMYLKFLLKGRALELRFNQLQPLIESGSGEFL